MSLEENKQIVDQFFKAMGKADGPGVARVTTDDFVFHPSGAGDIEKDAFIALISGVPNIFPDQSSHIDEMIAEGDTVAVRVTVIGTHRGQFGKFAPTGNRFSIQECFFFRIENGRIAEDWGLKDALGHYQQLGILPPDEEILR